MGLKNFGACLTLLISCWQLSAQTLFTYGNHSVSREEFLRAYNRNNSPENTSKLSYSEYLDLYSKFRIKVQSALDAGWDTLADQRAELEAFRYQLSDNYLKQDASVNLLVEEAIARSLKDIHLSHIYIPAPQGVEPADTITAKAKIRSAYEQLNNGEPFEKVAAPFNNPELGYITAFILPYQFENIAYSTPPGKFSKPFRSSKGFHILKNEGERKAVGQVLVAQILLAYPPDLTDEKQITLKQCADSIYKALLEGADFGAMALQYSDDNLTYKSGGEMAAFGVGQYDPVFEETAFALKEDGDISTPLKTAYGYHILKRLQRIPVIEDKENKDWQAFIREKVLQSDRMKVAHNILVKNIRQTIQHNASPADLPNDSAAIEYYRNHLELYNSEFAEQLNEFKQGNLLFGIMQEKVWDAASEDSNGLRNYYNNNPDKYFWENSADALILTMTNKTAADRILPQLENNAFTWREWTRNNENLLLADSARFELNQIPVAGRTNFTEGLITAPVINEQDSSVTFAYIIKLYNTRERKKFADAKGAVINDYQNFLEEKWVRELEKKYPVRIKKRVFRNLP